MVFVRFVFKSDNKIYKHSPLVRVMLWSKKEEKSNLPDIPLNKQLSIPKPPNYEADYGEPDNEDYHNGLGDEANKLPSFPDSPTIRGFSQTAIKEAVGESSKDLPDISSLSRESEEDEWVPSSSAIKELPPEKNMGLEEMPNNLTSTEIIGARTKDKDIFVKIDKFQAAKKAINNIKNKVEEIEILLNKIRETKIKEERELNYWESELTNIKAKITSLREDIFEKM